MQEICLLNPINSHQAFSVATSCGIKMLMVNASDVDHVSKVFSFPYHSPTWEISIFPIIFGAPRILLKPVLHAKKQTMVNRNQKNPQVICHQVNTVFLLCSWEASVRDYFGFESKIIWVCSGQGSNLDICCPFSFPTIGIGFVLLWLYSLTKL